MKCDRDDCDYLKPIEIPRASIMLSLLGHPFTPKIEVSGKIPENRYQAVVMAHCEAVDLARKAVELGRYVSRFARTV